MKEFMDWFGPQPEIGSMLVVIARLLMAAFLGGVVGLEREVKHKPAGLRTQMFICIGAAMFTILSDQLAAQWGGDHVRIAAQIIPGIGFIGAGSILHSRGSVSGLTTAATLFVVASIGMAVGGGQYLSALFATLMILLALHILGWLETAFNLKPMTMTYQVVGDDMEATMSAVNEVMEQEHHTMQSVHLSRADHKFQVQFTVECTNREQQEILRGLRHMPVLDRVESFDTAERE